MSSERSGDKISLRDALHGSSSRGNDYGTRGEASGEVLTISSPRQLARRARNDKTKDKGMATFIQNIVMGASDGFTVPFALAAGLTTKVTSSRLIVVAVVAELTAGLIAMGLGGYLSAYAERVFHKTAREVMKQKLENKPEEIKKTLSDILLPIGISNTNIDRAFEKLREDPDACVSFILKHELAADEEGLSDPLKSGLAVGFSYVIAGALPMIPYLIFQEARHALVLSVVVGLVSMFTFGWTKAIFLGGSRRDSALQTVLLGALAALCSYILAGSFD